MSCICCTVYIAEDTRTHLLCSCLLLFIVVVNTTPVLSASVIALLIQSCRIHMVKEAIQQGRVVGLFGVVVDLQHSRMRFDEHLYHSRMQAQCQSMQWIQACRHTRTIAAADQQKVAISAQDSQQISIQSTPQREARLSLKVRARGVSWWIYLYCLSVACTPAADTVVCWGRVLSSSVSHTGLGHSRNSLESQLYAPEAPTCMVWGNIGQEQLTKVKQAYTITSYTLAFDLAE